MDYSLGDTFPHDVNLDQTGGVSFRKGCFVGQEVVSRMQHRGTARRRILIVAGVSELPATGTAITANGRESWHTRECLWKGRARACPHRQGQGRNRQGHTYSGRRSCGPPCHSTRTPVYIPGGNARGLGSRDPDQGAFMPAKPQTIVLKKTELRAWQRMLSGRRLDLLDPSPLDIEIEDIAQGLARVARWNGQTVGEHAFSVAQHSLLVEQIFGKIVPEATTEHRLIALLHDAPEYVIGDMISPFKAVVGGDYKSVELRLQHAIHVRFSLSPVVKQDLRALIKQADAIAAYYEATRLAGFAEKEAVQFFGRPRGIRSARARLDRHGDPGRTGCFSAALCIS